MLIVAIIGALTPTLFFQTYAPVYNNNNTFYLIKYLLEQTVVTLPKTKNHACSEQSGGLCSALECSCATLVAGAEFTPNSPVDTSGGV